MERTARRHPVPKRIPDGAQQRGNLTYYHPVLREVEPLTHAHWTVAGWNGFGDGELFHDYCEFTVEATSRDEAFAKAGAMDAKKFWRVVRVIEVCPCQHQQD